MLRAIYVFLCVLTISAVSLWQTEATAQPLNASFPFTISNGDTAVVGMLPTARPAQPITTRVRAQNGHFYKTVGDAQQRIRFYGTELYYTSNFLDSRHAERLAKHLHKLGFNAVRLVGTDYNYWPDASLQLGNSATSSVTPSPGQFAKLDTLLYYFRQNGIYAFLSIHDFHYYSAADGVIHADSQFYWGMWQEYLDEPAARLQRDWAKTLLEHVNPLTGMRLADDPVVASVEFSSEQISLSYAYHYGLLNFTDSTHAYPSGNTICYSLSRHLDTLWTQYLLKKYGSEGAISSSFAGPTPGSQNLVNNGSFEDLGSAVWSFQSGNGASASQLLFTPAIDSQYCTLLHVTSLGANPALSDAYLYTTFPGMKADSLYECSLWLRVHPDAKHPVTNRSVYIVVSDYTTGAGSLAQTQAIDTVWRRYTFRFRSAGQGPQYFVIYFGNQLGDVLVDGINIHRTGETGLFPGEHTADFTLMRPTFGQAAPLIPAKRFQDMYLFYDSLEQTYFARMRKCIQDTIKSTAMLSNYRIGSWGGFMDCYANRSSDFVGGNTNIDGFTNRPGLAYSDSTWMISQASFLNRRYNGDLGLLQAQAIDQKPYILSSYLTPFISQKNQEILPFITSYASLQDWDGIFLSYYSVYREDLDSDYNRQYPSYNIAGNGTMLAAIPSSADAFMNYKISSPSSTIKVTHTNASVGSCFIPGKFGSYYNVTGYLDPCIGTIFKMRQSFGAATEKVAAEYPYNPTELDTATKVSETDEIVWNPSAPWQMTKAPKFESAVGYFLKDTVDLGAIRFARLDGRLDELAVSLQTFDTSDLAGSTNLFLSIGSRSQNTGTIWDADSLSVRKNWGAAPTQFAALDLQFWIRSDSSRVVCHTLDSAGVPARYFDAVKQTGTNLYSFTIDQTQRPSPWFWIEMTNALDDVPTQSAAISTTMELFPNPASDQTVADVNTPQASRVSIKIYDDLGRLRVTAVDGELSAGMHHIALSTRDLDAGHYIVRCETMGATVIKSLNVVK